MSLKIVVSCLAISVALGRRVQTDLAPASLEVAAANNETQSSLCNRWLIVEYSNGKDKKVEDAMYGTFENRMGNWQDVKLFEKVEKESGCVKTYFANCEQGELLVKKKCGESESSETRCLGGRSCFVSSRRSDLKAGDVMTVYDPEGNKELQEGGVKVYTINPSKGITLSDAPGRGNWKTVDGCYCCKHSYVNPLDNPFSRSSMRAAWNKGSDGNMECMLAWRMIGNAMGDDPVNAPAWAVFALIPEFMLTFADVMTLTIGRHLACAATCPLRSSKFEANKYAFTKIQTGQDMY